MREEGGMQLTPPSSNACVAAVHHTASRCTATAAKHPTCANYHDWAVLAPGPHSNIHVVSDCAQNSQHKAAPEKHTQPLEWLRAAPEALLLLSASGITTLASV